MTTLSARVPPDLAQAVQRIAKRETRTSSQIVARLLRTELERLGEVEPTTKSEDD